MTETSRKDESLRRRLIELTRDLIIIPSTRDRPEDIQRCMEFVINHVELPNELTIRRFCEKGSPSTVILPRNVSTPEVLLLAHLDEAERAHLFNLAHAASPVARPPRARSPILAKRSSCVFGATSGTSAADTGHS